MRGTTITFAFILLVCTATHAMAQQAPNTVDAEKDEPLAERPMIRLPHSPNFRSRTYIRQRNTARTRT